MTPAEHYTKAEELLAGHKEVMAIVDQRLAKTPRDIQHVLDASAHASTLLLAAQVHATLALAVVEQPEPSPVETVHVDPRLL